MNRKSLILIPIQKLECMKPKSGGGLRLIANNIVDWVRLFFRAICFRFASASSILLSYGLKKLDPYL
ncbi:uncharacterized protein PHALS_14715 [Plasmopara halstedii]|uniref:Uncharacterized protein n=1 Tax=Plasmopara halstedii TaxID=4781 RepID=A0A0P1A4T2_PLAHL|nr:uncharacterized protein PHALS_14715 [Plasmopara halstedii]CEG35071.1 hypothetical protein PHALS_14715 [Plasmopara halstedii]|eukprot:XP_024571440.1 hypothetical protein PHALS_14715 [Plasmopara halstedii]